ncbi:GGDEF domain-containing protein [Pseudoalteromonas sp. 2CM36K]|uniref:EAL domain-containing protein n=1 Tax=Pseudoalteromonas sp. 2CM36K TaxID=2929854 RepID=UPI0020BE92AF|nr:GGDEF domain-containing protein [Pseudoalteromonas sp. 2CM36K]MCK8101932.1 GGDEF domain-containing protein [Pseudoalteromonas sp. 2CM36K]
MLKGNLKLTRLALGTVFFLVSLIIYGYYTYSAIQSDVMRSIDNRLINAATSVKYILGSDYHDKTPQEISFSSYQNKAEQLSALANDLNIDSLYSMILIDENIYFTASSYTQDDQNNGKVTQYLDLYPEATPINMAAFLSTAPIFEVSTAHRGPSKTVYIPHIAKNGRTYLTAADISVDKINTALITRLNQALLHFSCVLFILLLVYILYCFGVRRSLMRDHATGFENHIALEKQLKKSNEHHLQIAIILVNEIDNISRFFGTKTADEVMKKLLSHFKQQNRLQSRIYRIATNKLAILTSKETPFDELYSIIQSHNKNTPFITDPFIYITLNAGVARGNKSLLLKNAHIALLQSRQGVQPIVNYSEAINDAKSLYLYNVEIAKEICEAFDAHRVVPYFQPVIDTNTNAIIRYDCSPRIVTSHGEILTPDTFSNAVNRLRMDGVLTRTLFTQCISRFRKSAISWGLTVCAENIADPTIYDHIAYELHRYPNPENITISILESQVITHYYEIKSFIAMVKSKGAKIVMHCWGNEFINTLNTLKIEVDGIKLDGAITKQLVNDENTSLFIAYIADIAQQLELELVVEAVENNTVAELLNKLNVTLMQGSYLGKPTPHVTHFKQQLAI